MKIKLALLCLVSTNLWSLKMLHLSFHKGCIAAIDTMAKDLGIDVTHWNMGEKRELFVPLAKGNAIYNITHDLAKHIWKKNKHIFNQFDVIITSDTAPLARIFLQNKWKKPLIVWICNRFDYADLENQNGFPDKKYYEIMQRAASNPLVYLVANAEFEVAYAGAKKVRVSNIIKPYFKSTEPTLPSAIDAGIDKKQTCFIPGYGNDLFYLNGLKIYQKLDVPVFRGYYSEPADLKDFKGIIHVPYAYSTIAFFENLANHIPYFIPSKEFLMQLHNEQPSLWHQDRGILLHQKRFDLSEWYCDEHAGLFFYFNSWDHLKELIQAADCETMRKTIAEYAEYHENTMKNRWKEIFLSIRKQTKSH